LQWLDAKVEDRIFANRSHGLEFLIARHRERKLNENKTN